MFPVLGVLLLAMGLPALLVGQEFTVTLLTQPRPQDPTYALPLVPTRTVRFTTEEGTWMSVDVSPDGRTLLFDLLGDLYTVPITGGKATRIMGGMAIDVQPRYSPDGTRILFVSDRSGADNIWIADADGRHPRPLVGTALDTAAFADAYMQPTWTPDGRHIVDGRSRLAYGGPGTQYYDVVSGAATSMPEIDEEVAFGSSARYAYSTRFNGILVYDFTTGRSRWIVKGSLERPIFRPVVSRDDRWLVYGTRVDAATHLRLRDLRTGQETWLARDVQPDAAARHASLGRLPNFAFTPDHQAIVVATGGKLWRIAVPSGERTRIPFQADVELDLGPLSQFRYPVTDSFPVRQIREPRLSPDGKHLAFLALDKLYLMDFPHGTPRRATTAVGVVENYPAWSPDGRYVAFTSYSDLAGGQIYRVVAARVLASGPRAAPERLTCEADLYTRLAYSPDSRRLVFGRSPWRQLQGTARPTSLSVDLLWMAAAGGVQHPITRLAESWYGGDTDAGAPPQFLTTEPDRVVVPYADVLVSMHWDGSDPRTLLRWPRGGFLSRDYSSIPPQAVLAPDGRQALVTYLSNVYLATLPPGRPDSLLLDVSVTPSVVPLHRISRYGAEFPAWSADGRRAYFALGRALFVYDVATGTGPARHDVNLVVARDRARGTLALRGARLITMRGDEVIARGDLVVQDGRIVAVGPSGSVAIPNGARVLDVTGRTILPGYVDLHAHAKAPFNTHKTQLPPYLAYLAYGVTTTRDPQTSTSDFLAYADRVETGDLLGPRILGTGPAVGQDRKEPLTSLTAVRNLVRRYGEFYQTQTLKQYVAGNRQVRQWIVMASHELGLSPTTEGFGDFKMSLSEMFDGYAGHEHNYEIFPLYRDVALLAAASGITYTPTLVINLYTDKPVLPLHRFVSRDDPYADPKLRRFTDRQRLSSLRGSPWQEEGVYRYPEVARGAGTIVAAGGRVGIGAHGELHGLGTHWELWMLASGGLSNLAVLRAGTLTGARALGLDRDLGSLEPGKLADLQVLDGNPLDELRQTTTLRYVMKDGRLYDANTLDERWPRRRKLGPQWWHLAEPPEELVRASARSR